MPGMKLVLSFALASLLLLPLARGQESAVAPQLPEQPVHTHPVLDHWQEVLMSQSEPERLFRYDFKPGEARELTEEEQRHVAEARERIAAALEAARALYQARMDIILNAMNVPGSPYFVEWAEDDVLRSTVDMWAPRGEAAFNACKQWVAEGFRRDLEGLSSHLGWLEPGSVEPSQRPGRQECLLRPELDSLTLRMGSWGYGVAGGYGSLNDEWRKKQDDFMKKLLALYGGGEPLPFDSGDREPFTGMNWKLGEDGQMTPTMHQFRANMQELIRREQKAWEHYRDVMPQLVTPYFGYGGSGEGYDQMSYESLLLDSRERFLCLLLVGCDRLNELNDLACERSGALLELHKRYRFGEIFTWEAHIFRHPGLEGNPWCIRFPSEGVGFIFVNDGVALRRFAARYPEGRRVEVRGYQSLEYRGTPCAAPEDDESAAEAEVEAHAPRVSEPCQVFHLLNFKVYGEEDEDGDSAGE